MSEFNDASGNKVATDSFVMFSEKMKNGGDFCVLKLALKTDDPELKAKYAEAIYKHNKNNEEGENGHYNSGFDLFCPQSVHYEPEEAWKNKMVDLAVVCEMQLCQCIYYMSPVIINSQDEDSDTMHETNITFGWNILPTGYFLYPRSSICKTPLMLSNHTGIIDSGYRGNIMAATRCLDNANGYDIEQYTRLFQICAPNLCRLFVVLVDVSELTSSERGTGGFGST